MEFDNWIRLLLATGEQHGTVAIPGVHRRVLDLIESGRKITDVARDLGVSGQTIYAWRRQDRIDRGLEPGDELVGERRIDRSEQAHPRTRVGMTA